MHDPEAQGNAAMRWAPDGHHVAVWQGRSLSPSSSSSSASPTVGGVDILSVDHAARYPVVPRPDGSAGEDTSAQPSSSSSSSLAPFLGGGGGLTPLFWAAVTVTPSSPSPSPPAEPASPGGYAHTALLPSSWTTSFLPAYRCLPLPEPLPPPSAGEDGGSLGGGGAGGGAAVPFLAWDGDEVAAGSAGGIAASGGLGLAAAAAAAAAASSSAPGARGLIGLPAAPVAYGLLRSPAEAALASSASGGASGPLALAAASVARLCESLAARGARGGGGGGGIRGASVEPAVVLGSGASGALPLLACLLPADGGAGGGEGGGGSASIGLLAWGTFPFLRSAPVDGSGGGNTSSSPSASAGGPALDGALSVACDASSLLSLRVVPAPTSSSSNSSSSATLRLRLLDTRALSAALPLLQHAGAALTLGDACIRHTARALGCMAAEWRAAHSAVVGALRQLETGLGKLASDLPGLRRARIAAAAYFPSSPAPLALSELYRLTVVGSTLGGGLAEWLEAGVDEAALVRLARGVEGALAALETLAVTRAARSCELLLVCVADLLRAVDHDRNDEEDEDEEDEEDGGSGPHPAGTPAAYTALGLTRPALEAAAEEATHLLTLLQALRGAAAHTRATYAAVFAHLRLLQATWAAAADSGAADAAAEDPAKREAARRKAAPTLAVSDAHLVRAAFEPAAEPNRARARAAAAEADAASGARAAAGVADPLGLGLGSLGLASDDPLGLGSILGGGGQATAAAPAPAPAATAAAQTTTSASAAPQHDAFVPFSLSGLIGTRGGVGAEGVGGAGTTTAGVDLFAEVLARPMSAYTAQHVVSTSPSSPTPRHERTLASQLAALAGRWRGLCAAPSLAVGRAATTSGEWALPGGSFAVAAAVCRAACVAYDDRTPETAPGEEGEGEDDDDDGGPSTTTTTEAVRHPFGAHTVLLPLPASVAADLSDGEIETPAVVVLRVSASGAAAPVVSSASVVLLPARTPVVASSFFGPGPGAVAAAKAAAAEAGLGYLPVPPLQSDSERCFVVVLAGPAGGAGDGDGDGDGDGTSAVRVAQLEHRALPYAPYPGAVRAGNPDDDSLLRWALQRAPRTAFADACPRCRVLPPSAAARGPAEDDPPGSDGAFVAWARLAEVDACGMRGGATVLVGGRQLFVLDLAEDEEDEGEEGDEGDGE